MVGGCLALEIYIVNLKTLERIGIIDQFHEFIWETCYNSVGSFELRCGMQYFNLLATGNMVQNIEDLNHIGIIERVLKETDNDGNESLRVSGRMGESLLDRRICYGEYNYSSQQPADIISDLVKKNAIDSRPIENLQIGDLADAPEGLIDYIGDNQSLLEVVEDICSISLLGFRIKADTEEKTLTLDIYYGENRTEKDNTQVDVTENYAGNVLANGFFQNGFSGWTERYNRRAFNYSDQEYFGPYPMTVSGGIVSKSKVKSIGEALDEDGDPYNYDIWEKSPWLEQSISLKKSHIYYMSATCYNPLNTVISFGIDKLMSFKPTNGYVRQSNLYVPPSDSNYIFFAGYGELEDKENQFVYFRDCMLIDLTDTFGVGEEPTLEWCDNNIYLDSAGTLKYKTQVISFIENYNMPLVFSRDRDLLISLEYEKISTNEKNYARIKGDNNVIITLLSEEGETKTGVDLKEMYINLSSISQTMDDIEIPISSYEAMLKKNAMATLKKMSVSETIEGEIYQYSNKKYGTDFYLGDIVSFMDESMNYSVDLRISSVEESWSDKGYSISIKMGENIPNIVDTIKLVSKGAKT